MRDLFGGTTATTTANTKPPTQLELAGLHEAITTMNRDLRAQETALRQLFALHGYDLANGDVLIRAPDVQMYVPPQYARQVRVNAMLEAGAMWFMRNPDFSLF
ncbi:MAG: hypothetical protein WKG03_00720 [Telluria sp.]